MDLPCNDDDDDDDNDDDVDDNNDSNNAWDDEDDSGYGYRTSLSTVVARSMAVVWEQLMAFVRADVTCTSSMIYYVNLFRNNVEPNYCWHQHRHHTSL